jgi:hypothetical protein
MPTCWVGVAAAAANGGLNAYEVTAKSIDVDNSVRENGFFQGGNSFDANNVYGNFAPTITNFSAATQARSGTIRLQAADITFDHGADVSIFTNAGDAGFVSIEAERLQLLHGSDILTVTSGPGKGGNVHIQVAETFLIEDGAPVDETMAESLNSSINTTSKLGSGAAGNITVEANQLIVGHLGRIQSETFSDSSAGIIDLRVDTLEVRDGGSISAATSGAGRGGAIEIRANEAIRVFGVDLNTSVLKGSQISSDTFGIGAAGTVSIQTPTLTVEQGGDISAESLSSFESGLGGSIYLDVSDLVLRSGGSIQTDTNGMAQAGNIEINAQTVLIDETLSSDYWKLTGISSSASNYIVGFTFENGEIQISELPTTSRAGHIELTVHNSLELQSGARISTQANNLGDAGPIQIQTSTMLVDNNSRITTEAQQGNAGPIHIDGGWLWLQNSQITTSAGGDGGAIELSPKQLILDGGFIQANAASGNGGDISITSQVLLYPATQTLLVGGEERFNFTPGLDTNIIQAVAPQGVSGQIDLTPVAFDITAALVPLRVPFADPNALLNDICQIDSIEEASALIYQGRGGLPSNASEPASPPPSHARLKRLLGER